MQRVICVLISILAAGGGFWATFVFSVNLDPSERWAAIIITTLMCFIFTWWFTPPLINWLKKLANNFYARLLKMPILDISCAVLGLILGLIIASLLNTVLTKINVIGPYLGFVAIIFLSYASMVLAYRKRGEIASLLGSIARKDKLNKSVSGLTADRPKILDTSVIIDGRITDICSTGFVEGTLVIPGFVLDELRHIADSADLLKRNRGRRGLDILNRLRKDFGERVVISDADYPDILEVDSKLVRLAQDLGGTVLTNDFNLNKVAQVHGVPVLNINELSNAVKPVVLPGEQMVVDVIKEGKEQAQGVAYLDDGTMIVVEGGKSYIGKTIGVEVTSVLQTAAGRMIFVRPQGEIKNN